MPRKKKNKVIKGTTEEIWTLDNIHTKKLMRKSGCYFVNPEEKQKLQNSMFEYTEEYGYKLKSHVPGQSPYTIAKEAGFEVPEDTLKIVALLHDICKVNYYKVDYTTWGQNETAEKVILPKGTKIHVLKILDSTGNSIVETLDGTTYMIASFAGMTI